MHYALFCALFILMRKKSHDLNVTSQLEIIQGGAISEYALMWSSWLQEA